MNTIYLDFGDYIYIHYFILIFENLLSPSVASYNKFSDSQNCCKHERNGGRGDPIKMKAREVRK